MVKRDSPSRYGLPAARCRGSSEPVASLARSVEVCDRPIGRRLGTLHEDQAETEVNSGRRLRAWNRPPLPAGDSPCRRVGAEHAQLILSFGTLPGLRGGWRQCARVV